MFNKIATGKRGYINYIIEMYRYLDVSEEEIKKKKIELENELEDKVYII